MKLFGKKKDEEQLDQDKTKSKTVAHPELKVISGSSVSKPTPAPQQAPPEPVDEELIPQVDNVIMVASGKGGVGKSTVAVNIAIALSEVCDKVGLLDSDVYGPSIPTMMGIKEQPKTTEDKKLIPLQRHNISLMSIGFMVSEEQALIWRGPMIHSAIRQMLGDVIWDELDYLVIDMPPGTGDIHLTLAQTVPVTGSVVVTTPQDIALIDAKKGLKMFEKVDIPVLGIIENMSLHICSNCQHEEAIFGQGGGEAMAKEYGVEFLGALPLDITIRTSTDTGVPTVAADPDSPVSHVYRKMARKLAASSSSRRSSTTFRSAIVTSTV